MISTVLVTGGAGFIGAHVTRELLALKHTVVVLDDLSGGYPENIPEGALFVQGSINDVEQVNALFDQYRFTAVFHLAAYAAEGLSPFIRRFNYQNNLIGSMNLINASINHSVQCFVFTSSIAVYGSHQTPFEETLTPQPEDPYGIAKYAVELDLKAALETHGLNHVIFRPHNVYGPLQNLNDPYRNVIGIFMRQLLSGQSLTIFGDGTQTRAFSFIQDVAPYIAQSIHNPKAWNQTYNIGADQAYTVNELATSVMRALKRTGTIQYRKARHEVQHAASTHQKLHRDFETVAPTPLDKGLQQMADWALQQPLLPYRSFEGIEVPRGLPEGW